MNTNKTTLNYVDWDPKKEIELKLDFDKGIDIGKWNIKSCLGSILALWHYDDFDVKKFFKSYFKRLNNQEILKQYPLLKNKGIFELKGTWLDWENRGIQYMNSFMANPEAKKQLRTFLKKESQFLEVEKDGKSALREKRNKRIYKITKTLLKEKISINKNYYWEKFLNCWADENWNKIIFAQRYFEIWHKKNKYYIN